MTARRRTPILLLLALVAVAAPGAARAESLGCRSGYSYAGIAALAHATGVSATVTAVRAARVTSGHVAAWIGIGGAGLGPGGTDEWLQVGISSLPGGTTEIYYEVALPDAAPVYTSVLPVSSGESHQIAIVESSSPGTWTVAVDGNPVALPIALPGSHGAWSPMLTSESFDGGVTTCNGYAFRFSGVRIAAAGVWQSLGKVQTFADSGTSVHASGGSLLIRHQ